MSSIYALRHENKFVFDFKKKAELFNPTFVLQCSLISNDSTTPCSSENRAENCLFTVDVTMMSQKLLKTLTQSKHMAKMQLFVC